MLLAPLIWPADWKPPAAEVRAAIEDAAAEFEVPRELLYSVARKESQFNPRLVGYKHGGNSETFRKSWGRYRKQVIPGRNPKRLTWGDLFPTAESWTAYGVMQLLPYNLIGKKRGFPASRGAAAMFDTRANVMCSASLLRELYDKHGSWDEALRKYNGSTSYVRAVGTNIDALRMAQGVS